MAEFSFIHFGYLGSLNVSDPNLVNKIQEHIKLGQRLELFSMLVVLLLGESVRNRVDNSSADCTLMELKEFYELNNSTVSLSTGEKLQIV